MFACERSESDVPLGDPLAERSREELRDRLDNIVRLAFALHDELTELDKANAL